MDSYQMAAQMAQFNTVQALDKMTQSMQNMEAYQASASSLQAVGLIGKKVEAKGNTLSIGQDNTCPGALTNWQSRGTHTSRFLMPTGTWSGS